MSYNFCKVGTVITIWGAIEKSPIGNMNNFFRTGNQILFS